MPDYNRQATVYWWTVVVLGSAAIAWSLHAVGMQLSGTQLGQLTATAQPR